ncbi:MAG: tetratricopeptide repeat protein [Phycisphaerae bacterium]
MSVAKLENAVSSPHRSDGQQLLTSTLGPLRRGDATALLDRLERDWPVERLVGLLNSDDDDVVKVAATCLGLVGSASECAHLARLLHHDDSVVVSMAEHALWRIWFRQAPAKACQAMYRAIELIEQGRCESALTLLNTVIRRCPTFAEAYNQRAIALQLLERYNQAVADCRRAVELNPTHFAALANMGHALSQAGRYLEALQTYRAVLQIHPRMEGVRQSIRRIRACCPQRA